MLMDIALVPALVVVETRFPFWGRFLLEKPFWISVLRLTYSPPLE